MTPSSHNATDAPADSGGLDVIANERREIEAIWRETREQWDDEVAGLFESHVILPLQQALDRVSANLS